MRRRRNSLYLQDMWQGVCNLRRRRKVVYGEVESDVLRNTSVYKSYSSAEEMTSDILTEEVK